MLLDEDILIALFEHSPRKLDAIRSAKQMTMYEEDGVTEGDYWNALEGLKAEGFVVEVNHNYAITSRGKEYISAQREVEPFLRQS